MIHPAPFRSVSRQRFRAAVNDLARRAPSISRSELFVGVLRVIALLGLGTATPASPRRRGEHEPAQRSALPLCGRRVRRGRTGSDARPQPARLDRGHVRRAGARARRAADSGRRVEHARDGAALPPHRGGARRPGVIDGAGPATFTFERPGGQRGRRTSADRRPGARAFADPCTVTTRPCCPRRRVRLYLSHGAWRCGRGRSRQGAPYTSVTTGRLALAAFVRSLTRLVRAPGPSGRRRRSPERRRGQHHLRRAHVALRVADVNRRGKLYVLIGRATSPRPRTSPPSSIVTRARSSSESRPEAASRRTATP